MNLKNLFINPNTFHELKVVPDSIAEKYIVNVIMPLCKDSVECRIGALFHVPYNSYVLSDKDYLNLIDEISILKGEST